MEHYTLGFNGATLPGKDLLTRLKAAASAGFSFYEPRVSALECFADRSAFEELKEEMEHLNISWLPLNALEDVIFPRDRIEFEKKREKVLRLADDFGLSTVVAVPAVKPPGISDLDLKENANSALSSLIKESNTYGLDVAFEMIGFSDRAFNSIGAARELVEEMGITLIVDTFHLAISEVSLEKLKKIPSELIEVVHVSDAIVSETINQVTDADRVLPGEGDLPLDGYIEAILDTGFKGSFSIEVFHEKYGEQSPTKVAERSHKVVSDLIERSV